jgi:peptide/nickel transport system substrate-binding protein
LDLDKKWPVYSGPYAVTRFDVQVKHMDLRYDWWAVDVGVVDAMPQVARIVQFGWTNDEVGGQMLINDEVDVTLDLRPATIEAILAQASDHITTHTFGEKPYGYMDWWPTSLFFNTLEEPYNNPDVRWAFAYAIDHQQVMDVGYGGAGQKTNLPFPGYPGLTKYRDNSTAEVRQMADAIYTRDVAKVEERMKAAGFEKNADGFFAKDGEVFQPEILTVDIYADIGPVVVEQLRQAGFDAQQINPPDAWTIMGDGTSKAFFRGHGGSVKDPWITLDMYTKKNSVPTGTNVVNESHTRWWDPDYEVAVNEMARTSPDDEAKMQELFDKCMQIWYTNLPEVPISEWFHRLAMNTTYWTGWPNKDDAYNTAPWHYCFVITLSRLKAAK